MNTILINNEEFYTVKQFAEITNRSQQTIRRYINIGNKIRKLEAIKIGNTLLIPAIELIDYPFTISGNNNNKVYHFTSDGLVGEQQEAM